MGRIAKVSIHDINWIVDRLPKYYNNNSKTNSLFIVKRILRDLSDDDKKHEN